MARLALDDAAWTSAWRARSVEEKSLLALGLLGVALTCRRPSAALVVLVVATGCALLGARVPIRTWLRALAGPMTFVLLGALSVAVSVGPGRGGTVSAATSWSAGPVAVTEGSLEQALLVLCRSSAAMAALMLLAATTPMTDLLGALHRLRVPAAVVDVAGLVYRMLFTLLDTSRSVREAQASRLGYSSGGAARRSVGLLAAAVLARSWLRAHRLESGLAGRAGSGATRLGLARSHPVSWPFVAGSAAVVAALAGLSLGGSR